METDINSNSHPADSQWVEEHLLTDLETESFPTLIALSNLPQNPNKKGGWKVRAGIPIDGPSSGYVIACEGGYYLGQRQGGRAVDLKGKTIREFKGGDIVPLHVQNFIDAVQSRDSGILNAPLETGHHSTGWCNLANVAFHAGAPYDRERISEASSLAAWRCSLKRWNGI